MQLKNGDIVTFTDNNGLVISAPTWGEVFAHAQTGLDGVTDWLDKNVLTLKTLKQNENMNAIILKMRLPTTTSLDYCDSLLHPEELNARAIVLDCKILIKKCTLIFLSTTM